MSYLLAFSTGMKTLTSLAATSGPYGIAAMILGLVAAVTGVAFMIARANKSADDSTLDQGGADAGQTAATLKNQADRNSEAQALAREEFRLKGPPKA